MFAGFAFGSIADQRLWAVTISAVCNVTSDWWDTFSITKTPLNPSWSKDHDGFRGGFRLLLGRAWASPTLAWLHWARVCVSSYACLDRSLTVNFTHSYFTISNICPRRRVLQLSRENKRDGLLPDCRVGMKESDSKDSSWIHWQHARQLTFCESDDHVTRQTKSDRQQDVRWLHVGALHECLYIAGISLIAHAMVWLWSLAQSQCSHRLWLHWRGHIVVWLEE